jgi:hypothetical protein
MAIILPDSIAGKWEIEDPKMNLANEQIEYIVS